MKLIIALGLFLLIASNKTFSQESNWNKWLWLRGEWKGEGSGEPGQGKGGFTFVNDLGGKVLVRRAHSEYPATATKPAVIHDDLMIVYLDMGGDPSKAIYFDNEGHTINYSITYHDKMIVMTSEKLANTPVFRLTYSQLKDNLVNTKFELSQDGTNFTTYVEGKCVRVAE